MDHHKYLVLVLALLLASVMVVLSGCANTDAGKTSDATSSTESATAGKIPVTTASEEARKEFLQGRDLQEKLLIQDSIQHFDRAIALDPNFASAHLNRAAVSPTGKEFLNT